MKIVGHPNKMILEDKSEYWNKIPLGILLIFFGAFQVFFNPGYGQFFGLIIGAIGIALVLSAKEYRVSAEKNGFLLIEENSIYKRNAMERIPVDKIVGFSIVEGGSIRYRIQHLMIRTKDGLIGYPAHDVAGSKNAIESLAQFLGKKFEVEGLSETGPVKKIKNSYQGLH